MGIGKFNWDDHYIYYCGQESLRRNGVALIVNNRVWNTVLGCNLKNERIISVCFQGKRFSITVIQIYAPTTNAEEAEVEGFYEDLQHFLELTPKKKKKKSLFYQRGLEWKVESQELPWITVKFGLGVQNEAGQRLTVLSGEHAGHNKYPFPAIQKTTLHMNLIRWSIYQIDYGLCSRSWRSSSS